FHNATGPTHNLRDRTAPVSNYWPGTSHRLADTVPKSLIFACTHEHINPMVEGFYVVDVAQAHEAPSQASRRDLLQEAITVGLIPWNGIACENADHPFVCAGELVNHGHKIFEALARAERAG